MRVLWLVRDNLERHGGGDTVQILQTAAALRRLGIMPDIRTALPARLTGYDVAHLWHLDRLWENLPYADALHAAGVPMVLSTIWWPADEFDRHARAGLQGWLARRVGSAHYQTLRLWQRHWLARWEQRRRGGAAVPWRRSFREAARTLLARAAVILPNSVAEQRQIEQTFGLQRPCVAVTNAVDGETFGGVPDGVGPRAGVLAVGRIEPRKNQLALIQAWRGEPAPLTIIGAVGRYSAAYGRRCRAAAGPNVRFVGACSPLDLRVHYQQSAVHACVSWYETPGLASLEAALCGCAIVVTPGGSVHDYFRDDVHYADPRDPATIRKAVRAALAAGSAPYLAARIARECTWAAAAEQTLAAYRKAVGKTAERTE